LIIIDSFSITAEIGTMVVTEQVDALESLAIDPIRYLAMPRIFSGFVMIPVLTVLADFVGIIGAYFVAYLNLDLPPEIYFGSVKDFFSVLNVMSGLIKAFVFGFLVSSIGTYLGYIAKGGARGVGRATTSSTNSVALGPLANALTAACAPEPGVFGPCPPGARIAM